MIQAQTIRPATPHRTALKRLSDPTPTIDPVIVWVVLIGIPKNAVTRNTQAAPDSAQKPSTGRSFTIFCPMVLTMRHPPHMIPKDNVE